MNEEQEEQLETLTRTVADSLEAAGILGKIKGRKSKEIHNTNVETLKIKQNDVELILTDMIREYFAFYKFEFSSSTYVAESNLDEKEPLREEIQKKITEKSTRKTDFKNYKPLLLQVFESFLSSEGGGKNFAQSRPVVSNISPPKKTEERRKSKEKKITADPDLPKSPKRQQLGKLKQPKVLSPKKSTGRKKKTSPKRANSLTKSEEEINSGHPLKSGPTKKEKKKKTEKKKSLTGLGGVPSLTGGFSSGPKLTGLKEMPPLMKKKSPGLGNLGSDLLGIGEKKNDEKTLKRTKNFSSSMKQEIDLEKKKKEKVPIKTEEVLNLDDEGDDEWGNDPLDLDGSFELDDDLLDMGMDDDILTTDDATSAGDYDDAIKIRNSL